MKTSELPSLAKIVFKRVMATKANKRQIQKRCVNLAIGTELAYRCIHGFRCYNRMPLGLMFT